MSPKLSNGITRTKSNRSLKKIGLILLFIVSFSPAFAQSDSVRVEFRFELRYQGAIVSINGNYRYILEYLVETLEKDPTLRIHIRGHVCCGPGEKTSLKRAKNVYRYLKRNGIAEERMTYKGYSNEIPKAFPEKTAEDEARNRRVDFILYRKTDQKSGKSL